MNKRKISRAKIGLLSLLLLIFFIGICSLFNPLWWYDIYGAEKWMLGPATMTNERTPKWSPDSQYIAFLCGYSYLTDEMDSNVWDNPYWDHEESDICVYDFKNEKLERLTFERHKSTVQWSTDGSLLVWFTNETVATIYDFGKRKELLTTLYVDYSKNESICTKFMWSDLEHPCWVFRWMPQEVFFRDYVGHYTTGFEWSLDGEFLAYLKEKYNDRGNDYDALMVKDAEGNILFESDTNLFGFYYDWSPTNSILAWRKACCRNINEPVIALTQFPIGKTEYIPIDPDYYWSGEWFPSGYLLEIGYDDDWDGRIKIISLECTDLPFSCRVKNERAYQLAHPEQFVYDTISLSPDGKYLAYSSDDESGKSRIWIIDLETGEETLMSKDQ